MRAIPRWARLGALVVLVYGLLLLPAVAETPPGTIGLLQFNMCGDACGTHFVVVDDLEREIRSESPEPYLVTLQEVCRSQYDALTRDLHYGGHFQSTIPNRCWDGTDYGIAVLARTPDVTWLGSWPLPNPTNQEPRTVLCVRTPLLVGCATHLDTDARNRPSQVAEVARRTGVFDGPVVVGGDFNTLPDDPIMAPMGERFVEADAPAERFTSGCSQARCGSLPGYAHPIRKIDYLFLARGGFTNVAVTVGNAPHSDHAPLRATVQPSIRSASETAT